MKKLREIIIFFTFLIFSVFLFIVLFNNQVAARVSRSTISVEDFSSWSLEAVIKTLNMAERRDEDGNFIEIGRSWFEMFRPPALIGWLGKRTPEKVALVRKAERIKFLVQLLNLSALSDEEIESLSAHSNVDILEYGSHVLNVINSEFENMGEEVQGLTRKIERTAPGVPWNIIGIKNTLMDVRELISAVYRVDLKSYNYLNKEVLWKMLSSKEKGMFRDVTSGNIDEAKQMLYDYLKVIDEMRRG